MNDALRHRAAGPKAIKSFGPDSVAFLNLTVTRPHKNKGLAHLLS